MKKLLFVLLTAVLVSQAYASQDIMAEFQDLNAEYQQLVNEENARFEEERMNCEIAKKRIVEIKEAIKNVEEKLSVTDIERESRYFKDDYDALVKRYREYLGRLQEALANNEGIVADFNRISAIRGNQN